MNRERDIVDSAQKIIDNYVNKKKINKLQVFQIIVLSFIFGMGITHIVSSICSFFIK
jgi:hypothetical protein